MLKIAFCDDETQETRRLEALLEEYAADRGQDFAHTSYQSPVELMAEVEKGTRFDIILLDVMMPGMDGFAVLKEIRRKSRVPVLMLTARGEAEDRIEGLEIGADDYLAKPFLPKELLLRVGAILSRAYPEQNKTVELAGATVDMTNAEVWKHGEKQTLTAKEMQLFEKLYQNAGRIVTTGILCETICGEFWQGYESTLSTHIRHLREKIEENPSKPVSLVTVKGLGYRLNLKEVSP